MNSEVDTSRYTNETLAQEIFHNLQAAEETLPPFHSQSPQIESRRHLVDWLSVISDQLQLCNTARQLSVTLMDYFMDNYEIEEHLLQLVATGSLLVAAKVEEQEYNIPKVKVLNRFVLVPGYEIRKYKNMEFTLLNFFQWKVCLPTPAHFTDYLLRFSVLPTDRHLDEEITDFDKVYKYICKYTDYFLEISLQDEWYRKNKPSLVASACIASARVCLYVYPPWNAQLAKAANYNITQIHPLVVKMIKTYNDDEHAQSVQIDSVGNSPCSSTTSVDTSDSS